MTKLHELAALGQAIWLDYIRRSFLSSGEMQGLVHAGIRGVTSNPSIFEKAIAGSADYDDALQDLVAARKSVEQIYETLALEDIRRAAALLRPVHEETGGADGYVSLEVSPHLADDTEGTVAEAQRLFSTLDLPNVMIKVPATAAGIPAIEILIGRGVNVNVTLIFSLAHYEAAANAYIAGLGRLLASGGDLSTVASVASFFVSRVDTAVDAALERVGNTELLGKIANDNAKVAYARFQELFSGARWESLARAGGRVQRPLWASTGTKNPAYSDTLYVDNLIGPDTVNTVPPATLQAFMDHGAVARTVDVDVAGSKARLAELSELGVDLGAVTRTLQQDGVALFAKSFEELMASIAEKREHLLAHWQPMSARLGSLQAAVDRGLEELRAQQVMGRIWSHDHTVWKKEPAEILQRLGWLNTAEVMGEHVEQMREWAAAVSSEGYTHALLLGMGGSSLAPEVFRRTFGVREGFLDLSVLDSTDPGAVLGFAESLDPARTLYIVSTKSGGTVETLSFFKYFYNRVGASVGWDRAGEHFVAITDPGSRLAEMAAAHTFRTVFLNDPNIGGRYSALSYFGLVPAALLGVDLGEVLHRALTSADNCESCNCPVEGDNHGGQLGVILAESAKAGRDKLTLVLSPAIESFGDWVEQLVAESTGKEGKGILPVVGEPLGPAEVYGQDRLFVHLKLEGDDTHNAALQALEEAGHPVVRIRWNDRYDLGGQFFLWEMATAVAGACIGINPFDQPNVESAKVLAHELVAAYQSEGSLPETAPSLRDGDIRVYGDVASDTAAGALRAFLDQAQAGSYVAIQAYIVPTPEVTSALTSLRTLLRDRTRLATTVGFGPRFLHSTGQLHKGDAGNGLFLQFTADDPEDVDIPDEVGAQESSVRFGVLKAAQALGDLRALLENGRRGIRFHLGKDALAGLKQLLDSLA